VDGGEQLFMVREPTERSNDRAAMRKADADTDRVACLYYDLHAEMIESGVPDSHPVAIMCEELAAGLEERLPLRGVGKRRGARLIVYCDDERVVALRLYTKLPHAGRVAPASAQRTTRPPLPRHVLQFRFSGGLRHYPILLTLTEPSRPS